MELCSHLELDGLTPSSELLLAVLDAVDIPVLCMARPYPGEFYYTETQFQNLLEDAQRMKALGAHGLVSGLLTAEGAVDVAQLERLMEVADGLPVTFHRAFDYVEDAEAALEILIAHGVRRILTSGCRGNAEQGMDQLKKLVELADGRVDIVLGGGVRAHNLKKLQQATGATEFHSSLDRHPTPESVRELVQSL